MRGSPLLLMSLALACPAVAQAQQSPQPSEPQCYPGITVHYNGLDRNVRTLLWVDGVIVYDDGGPGDPGSNAFNNVVSAVELTDGDHVFRIQSPFGDFTRTLHIAGRKRSLHVASSTVAEEAIMLREGCATWTPG